MNGKFWTVPELKKLKERYASISVSEAETVFDRDWRAIQKRANQMKLRRSKLSKFKATGICLELKRIRENKRMTLFDIYTATGFHWGMVGRYERGECMPSLKRLNSWCDALGVRLTAVSK